MVGIRTAIEFIFPYWLIFYTTYFPSCHGHGRLIDPPSRASAWRYGFQTLPNYNDHELYCGGFTRQWRKNEGKCGECGDAWDLPVPRPHEYGGAWGKGVIVKRYLQGLQIPIRVELTASHMGYFEFRICPQPDARQECLDRYLLKIISGSPNQPAPNDLETRFYPRNGSRIYEVIATLPKGLTCNHCVLQWRYIAGNNWGICADGNGAVGCGPQEEFRACSDIALYDKNSTPNTFDQPITTERIEDDENHKEYTEGFNYSKMIITLILLILFVATATIAYIFRKQILIYIKFSMNSRVRKRYPISISNISSSTPQPTATVPIEEKLNIVENESTLRPPVPAPRLKRKSPK
ncbi:unnamed protein product [Ceratitis capitata]|uniref:(Mediterranean fruit fly) hypothetical protein n=1 Tax=Ceratitis capitata TaxID=7213 RepID=A0A811U981_CERCA|nr:unnamed protein product [Ceratitis capitata]